MKKRDLIQAGASLDNLRQNLNTKALAKEILLEENYVRFIKSYRFTFLFQLLGTLAGFFIPSIVLLILFRDIIYCAFGAVIGILWMCLWLPVTLLLPPTKIYRKFAKWHKNSHSTINELDIIFYKD